VRFSLRLSGICAWPNTSVLSNSFKNIDLERMIFVEQNAKRRRTLISGVHRTERASCATNGSREISGTTP
jgi:hypothetical protein